MVVVIGYQAENDWLDVINVKLPLNPADTQVTFTGYSAPNSFLERTFSFPSAESILSSYSRHLLFKTSFGVEGTGLNGDNYFFLTY